VPRFIKKIATGNLRGSALTILDANILGLSCSRVCPVDVLCEGSCVMHGRGERPISIGLLQRHAMEHFYRNGKRLPGSGAPQRKERVACIGGGPASLACAAELRRSGFQVTIFERREWAGGLNTYGVAEYKFRPADSLQEVALIADLGVKFRTGHTVGTDIPIEQIEAEFDAIFLGLGLGDMEALDVAGGLAPHVVDALEFIADYKTKRKRYVGRRVVVIGGGNTAIDAACAARRLGAAEVHLLYRRSEREMPAFEFEFAHAQREGITFHFQSQPIAVHQHAVECVRMELGPPDPTGRRTPEASADTNFEIPCDMVIPAIGQSKLIAFLNRVRGIQLDRGRVIIDRETGQTTNPKYYAGGDCVNGGREVVDAVADGKRAAAGIAEASNG
jgi:glutamate synthase (NADPH/NADH) small chain